MSTEWKWNDKWFNNKTKKVNYDYKGKKNTKNFKLFKSICRMNKEELKIYLTEALKSYYDEVINEDGFIYVRGTNSNVLLTAHMDTVHDERCKDIYEYKENNRTILSSPQGIGGDDRCGIYAILKVLETTDFRPYIIFCEDEEIGGIGSGKFCKTNYIDEVADEVNFMIEIDRANANDAVFYEDENEEFQKYIEGISGNVFAIGSFSDICNLSDYSDVSSFNISCGYYNAHTTSEYVVMEELDGCIKKIIDLLKTNQDDNLRFVYQPSYYYDFYNKKDDITGIYFTYMENKEEHWTFIEGTSLEECAGCFLIENPTISWSDVIDYEIY